MGLERGSAVANSVPDCLSFVRGPGTVLGNVSRRWGRSPIANFWKGVPWGKAAIADFSGREFAELAACDGRLGKGSKVEKSIENPSKKVPKLIQNGSRN